MHPATPDVAAALRRAGSPAEKIRSLQGRYEGAPCVIVTCGPSLGAFDAARLRQALDGILTIVVKHGVGVVGEQTDFHCWNSFNVARFADAATDTIRCFVAESTGRMIQHNDFDLQLPMVDANGDLATSLAARHDFDAHRLDETLRRPFGPGIMYELCFHLAVHLGVSEVVTVGWDVADAAGKNTHFYDRPEDEQFFESVRQASPGVASNGSRLPEVVRSRLRWIRTRAAHQRGETYNRTRVLAGESELMAESTGALADWLRTVGVDLRVTTDSPFLDERIPRLSRDEFFEHLDEVR